MRWISGAVPPIAIACASSHDGHLSHKGHFSHEGLANKKAAHEAPLLIG
jgi:hypothetical protein